MKLIKTPPPTLLRARFAAALNHLPSVPSVVLPIYEPSLKRLGSPAFKAYIYWVLYHFVNFVQSIAYLAFIKNEMSSF